MKTKFTFILVILVLFSCEEMVTVTFSESSSTFDDNAIIEINVPKAEGEMLISENINSKIENHIANMLNFGEDESKINLDEAIKKFDEEYAKFKTDFEESALVWEAMFDGEVTYQSSEIITIAINSYLNTGGAHGNMNITLLNFNTVSGNLLELNDIVSDKTAFETIAKKHFKIATQSTNKDSFGDYFFGEDFHLPENIGLNDEGVILFYNVYEIASYAVGITEFTIPFDEIETYLNIF